MDVELGTVKMMTAAVQQGLQHQAVVLQQVLHFCDQLKAGQDHIISNQVQMMNAILATKAQVDLILQTINSNDMKTRTKLLNRMACNMKIHLEDPGEPNIWAMILCAELEVTFLPSVGCALMSACCNQPIAAVKPAALAHC